MPTVPARVGHLHTRLAPLQEHPHVAPVRQQGFMVGIPLVKDRRTGQVWPRELRMGHRVCMAAREHGVIIRPLGDVVVLMPAPAMPTALLDELVDVTVEAIHHVIRSAP